MSFSDWRAIIEKAEALESMADQGEWPGVFELADALEQCLHLFFEEKVVSLSEEEQARIKQEGTQLMSTISAVLAQAQQEKKSMNLEAGKMARGKKGISAYKKV